MFSSHRCHAILPWLFISLLSYGFSNLSTITINANETDRLALLSIKSQLHDPLGVTSSWNNSVPLCQWTGVSCGPRHQRVIGLNLRNQSIGGPLSPFIGNLSFLRSIQLQENKFYGEIPHEVGLLSRLENLRLSNNSFSGTIPTNLSHCSNLISFIANYNNLEGEIPAELGNLLKLQTLSISVNQLTGQLPASIGNISSLQVIYLVENSLTYLNLGANNFFGIVPPSIYNITSLDSIVLAFNQFNGTLPSDIGYSLPFLKRFVIGLNNFTGSLPISITNASNLEDFTVSSNYFSGKVSINFTFNQISGNIHPGTGNLVKLNALRMQFNQLSGTIPYVIGKLKNLQALDLSENSLQGSIPTSIGNLTGLTSLLLDSNNLKGNIPSNLGNCQILILLSLSQNNLNGTLPQQILDVVTLSLGLNLSDNLLSGSFPSDVGKLKNLISLDISGNHFSREIPVTLGSCTSLEYLSLQGNSFSGSIPPLISLRSIKRLDFSSNNLSGQIPKSIGEVPAGGVFSNVTEISLVGNDNLCGGLAELHLPSCHSKGSEKSKINLLKVVIPVLVSFFILSSCFIIIFTRRKKFSHKTSIMLHMEEPFPMISYAELSKATNEFSSSNMIGEGSYGLVYKGLLAENGLLVAVKVINLQRKGASKSFIAECEALRNVRHRNLIKIMTICSCIDFKGNDFKALVYEYMQHGSLEEWLHRNKDQQKTTNLSLIQRLNIAIDVASAIEYLHHHCQPPMVHGDLKPSNVLLDHDLVAHVGDFGLAKFLSDHSLGTISGTQSSSIGIKGTIGYVAPEYGMGSEVSISGDVYSLGILLLEMFTGRRPTDNVFNDSLNLHDFVKTASPERATEIVEPSLLLDVRADNNEIENFARLRGEGRLRTEGCLVGVLRIGVLCSVEPSAERMEMTDVVVKLCAVRENFLGRWIVDVGPNARLSS
ncbi:hypothetical protein ACOSQ3_025545 [Xanthoceras sorbifolium]